MSQSTDIDNLIGRFCELGGVPLISRDNLLIVGSGELVLPSAATCDAECIHESVTPRRALVSQTFGELGSAYGSLITQPILPQNAEFAKRRWQNLCSEINSLPPAPQVAQAIIELYQDPNASIDDLAAIVEQDGSLSTQVISWANSPYYGLANEVTSVKQAILRALGFDLVMGLCLGLSLTQGYKDVVSKSDANRIWLQSLFTAEVAQQLALIEGNRDLVALSYTAGLMHNIGSWLISQQSPGFQIDLVSYFEANPHMREADIEQALIGINFIDISKLLFNTWQLPESLYEATFGCDDSQSDGALAHQYVRLARRFIELDGQIPVGVEVDEQYRMLQPAAQTILQCLKSGLRY